MWLGGYDGADGYTCDQLDRDEVLAARAMKYSGSVTRPSVTTNMTGLASLISTRIFKTQSRWRETTACDWQSLIPASNFGSGWISRISRVRGGVRGCP
jgi:hypothetical protein